MYFLKNHALCLTKPKDLQGPIFLLHVIFGQTSPLKNSNGLKDIIFWHGPFIQLARTIYLICADHLFN